MSNKISSLYFSREKGIRTLDMLPYTRFPSVRLQPLGHLSFCDLQITQKFIIKRNLLVLFYDISPRIGVSKIVLKTFDPTF